MNNEEQKIPKRSIELDFQFGYISKGGYRHFPLLWLALGTNGFSLCIIGLVITIKMW